MPKCESLATMIAKAKEKARVFPETNVRFICGICEATYSDNAQAVGIAHAYPNALVKGMACEPCLQQVGKHCAPVFFKRDRNVKQKRWLKLFSVSVQTAKREGEQVGERIALEAKRRQA